MDSYGWSGMGWMWIFWVLLIVGLVLLIILLVRLIGGGMPGRGAGMPDRGAGPKMGKGDRVSYSPDRANPGGRLRRLMISTKSPATRLALIEAARQQIIANTRTRSRCRVGERAGHRSNSSDGRLIRTKLASSNV